MRLQLEECGFRVSGFGSPLDSTGVLTPDPLIGKPALRGTLVTTEFEMV